MPNAAYWREALLRSSLDAVVLMDARGRLVDFNAEAAALFLLTPASMGQSLGDLIVPPDLREAHRAGLQRFLSTGESRIIGTRIEIDAVRTDGYRFPVELTIATIQGDTPLFVAHLRDIQEQKMAERRLKATAAVGKVLSAAQNSDEAVEGVLRALGESLGWPLVQYWEVDQSRQRLVRRQSWEDTTRMDFRSIESVTEFALREGLPGQTWADASPQWVENVPEQDWMPRMRGLHAQGINTGLAFPVMFAERVVAVIEAFAPDRWPRQPELLAVLQAMGGQLGHFLEELHARAETERARRDAEQANRLKDEFLSVASHELRTPLNAVLGWVHLLRKGRLTGDAAERAMEAIERNVMIQSRLVGDLLDMSRIIAGKFQLELTVMDALAPMWAALEVVRPAAEARKITLAVPAHDARLWITGDLGRLQQVFWNVLSNAVKFTPAGGRIEVSIARREGDVEITVTDTGIGVPNDFAPRAFDRFAQADQHVGRETGGLGLGLSIARQFVELHGGTIVLRSAGKDLGTEVTVRLPLRDAGAGPDAAARSASVQHSLVGIRVLMASDRSDEGMKEAADLLEGAGASVEHAASPEEALGCLSRAPFDIVVSDFRQFDTSLWLAAELNAQQRATMATRVARVVAVSSAGGIDTSLFARVLPEPLDGGALRQAVQELIAERR